MKIVHICLGAFFPDGYSYQENMLPKFHKQMGYDVEVIASLLTFDKNGNQDFYEKASVYKNEFDIKVTRLEYKKPRIMNKFVRRFIGLSETLEQANPDIIFVHNCQFMDIKIVVRYAKMHNVTIYVDNHADFSNSARNVLSKKILHGMVWKHCANIIEPYTKKFYGVLPARVEFLKNIYKLPADKCELLVMGADDDAVKNASSIGNRKKVRQKYGIKENDFLIMTGGKIDKWKTQTLLLMEAVKKITDNNLKLIIFGSVTPELQKKVNSLADGTKIQYVGWINSLDSYQYFAAADLVVFPGRHSVFWEQVAAQGIPMLCKEWNGTKHIDVGGNVRFLTQDSVEEIKSEIEYLINNPNAYENMKNIAVSKGMRQFSYKDIAKRAIQQGDY